MTPLILILIGSGFMQGIVMALAAILSPRMSRPDLFFSITVEPSFRNSAAGSEILHGFNRSVSLYTLISLMVVLGVLFTRENLILSSLLLVAACAVQWTGIAKSYAAALRRALLHQVAPSTEREAALQPRPRSIAGSWMAQLGPFLILGLFSLWLWLHWDQIPERFPVHWGANGHVNGWANRTIRNVFALPIMGAITCAFLAFVMQAMYRGARRIHSSGPEAQKESRNLKNVMRLMLGIEYWFAVMFGLLGLLPFFPSANGPSRVVVIMAVLSSLVSLIVVIVAVQMGVKSGQGGWRLADQTPSRPTEGKSSPVGDRTPDSCWKGGIIYYNPNDPAVWVEKRFGYGWTLNMAAPRAWVIMGAILLFGLGMPLLSVFLLKK